MIFCIPPKSSCKILKIHCSPFLARYSIERDRFAFLTMEMQSSERINSNCLPWTHSDQTHRRWTGGSIYGKENWFGFSGTRLKTNRSSGASAKIPFILLQSKQRGRHRAAKQSPRFMLFSFVQDWLKLKVTSSFLVFFSYLLLVFSVQWQRRKTIIKLEVSQECDWNNEKRESGKRRRRANVFIEETKK